jgi:hypothetical protein
VRRSLHRDQGRRDRRQFVARDHSEARMMPIERATDPDG